MTKLYYYAFAIAITFALIKTSLQSEKRKENVITSIKPTTRKEDLCTNIEYTHTMLIEKFFVDALNIFKGIKPACICVQLCKDKPTYCYPNGCIHDVKKYNPNDDEDVERTAVNSTSTLTTETEVTSVMTPTTITPSTNFEYSIFPDTTEDIEAIYIRQLLKPSETSSTHGKADKEDCHSSTTPPIITVSQPYSTQTKFSLWSRINQKRLPHPYIGPHFHTPQETTMPPAPGTAPETVPEMRKVTKSVKNAPEKIISEKTHWPSNDSLQMHSHKTYGDDHKENWFYEIFDETYKSTLAQSEDYDTVVDDVGVDNFHHSILANLHDERVVNEYLDKNNNDKSTTGKNYNLKLAIPDFLEDYNVEDTRRNNNFSVTPDVPIIKGKVTNRWGSELDYAYDYTDNGTSRDPLNDVVVHNYSNDLNDAYSLRYTEPLYKSRETYSLYNTTEKLYPTTVSGTERKRLKLDRRSQVQNFSPFLADRNNYIERKTNNETIYVVRPNTNKLNSNRDANNLSSHQLSSVNLPVTPYSTMYDETDSDEDEYRVSRKYVPTTKAKPRQPKRRRQGDLSQRNKMNVKKSYYNNHNTENNTRKPAERKEMLRYETNSPNKRISTYTPPEIPENVQKNKYHETYKRMERLPNRAPFSRLRKRDSLKLRPKPEHNGRKRREKSSRNSRKFSDEVRTTTYAYSRRNSRDLKKKREGMESKKGFRENRRIPHKMRFDRIKQAG